MEQKNKLCPHCKKEVDSGASRCPHCQGKIYIWTRGRKILMGFIILTVIVLVLSNSSGNENSSTKNDSQVSPQEQAIKVSAAQLVNAYEANEVSADAQYKNRIVEVTGTIKSIGKDIMDQPYVTLDGSNAIASVQCMFDKANQGQLASLNKDTRITLRGRVSGTMMNVILRDCSIVK